MAGTGLLALLDDIAGILDDVATMSKIAAKKTAGVIGDDLALNAQQVNGISAAQELPIVWAIAKGSFVNKLILVPAAVLISVWLKWLLVPLLLLGGGYLCFEGVVKLWPSGKKPQHHEPQELDVAAISASNEHLQGKVKAALRTDFVLSAEIITIALDSVSSQSWWMQLAVLAVIGVAMTVGVYGLVAGIVKIDDVGLWLNGRGGKQAALGNFVLWAAPHGLRVLSVVGTAAMFLVGGGIVVHNIPALAHALESTLVAGFAGSLQSMAYSAIIGISFGVLLVAVYKLLGKLFKFDTSHH